MTTDLDALIEAIYRAGADATQWNGVLAALTKEVQGAGAALHAGDVDCSGFAFGADYNVDPEALDQYARYYFSINPLNPPLTRQRSGAVIGEHMLVPRQAYTQSEFYNDYSRRFDIDRSATIILADAEGYVSCLGIVRGCNSESFSPSELDLLRRLLPHLQRAIDLNRQLAVMRDERDEARAALDRMELAVLFLGESGIVVRANRAAEELLRRANGLTVRGGRLRASGAGTNYVLGALIDGAINRSGDRGGAFAIPRPGKQRPLLARVIPYISEIETEAPNVRAIMFLRDPDVRAPGTIAQVSSLYGLTKSEARLLETLMEVSDVDTVANQLQITKVTARNHMARIMAKTGTNKHAELVRVVLSSRVPIR